MRGHPLALCCHYPFSKYRSASIAMTGTVRVKFVQPSCDPCMKPAVCLEQSRLSQGDSGNLLGAAQSMAIYHQWAM